MAVLGPHSVTLEVPDLEPGMKFYTDAGLEALVDGNVARFYCTGQRRASITLLGGAPRKRLHHLTLRAARESFDEVKRNVPKFGGELTDPPQGIASTCAACGLWIRDPHGLSIHLLDAPEDPQLAASPPFEINAPGRIVRHNRSAMPAKSKSDEVRPLRLGHVLLFTPDVLRSIEFFSEALGMGLADRSQDIVAFMCSRHGSDHHVVAFAKSSAIGFHHASFQVPTPDDVGRGGRALIRKGHAGHWGFGRHTIGSNFFHYIQDPWGSWFEYYSDIDYINDYRAWTPTNYELEDSLEHWGPELPHDFVHNYETGER